MPAKVILNPYAARWSAKKRQPEAEEALRTAGVDFELVSTNAPGHATRLAQEAQEAGFDPIIIAGGDGTIGEIINGLHNAQPDSVLGPVGILPLGTANDLVRNLELPIDLNEAAKVIASGNTKQIDLGQVNSWLFGNNSAVGLEPVVTIYNERMVWLRGVIRYLVAAIRAIASKPEWNMKIAWDDGEYEGPVSLVSVGNCPVTGGLFRMAPAADPNDGRLTFVYGYAPTRRKMFTLLPRAISGAYVNDPIIHQHHTRRLHIQSLEPTPLQVDGELRERAAVDFTYQAVPNRLQILFP